jgi:hypothetical protein
MDPTNPSTNTAMTPNDRQRFAVLLTVLAFVAAIFFGRVLLGGDGDGPSPFARGTTAEQISTKHAVKQSKAAKKTAASKQAKKAKQAKSEGFLAADSFEVFATRDPFQPPVNVTPTTQPPSTTPTTSPTDRPPLTTPTSEPTTEPTKPPTSTPTTQPPSFTPGTGESVAVLDVSTDPSGAPQAQVRVGSTVYTVRVGDTFATSYRVVSLDEPCGQFLFGDNPFTLCEGEETIK